jgi:hypothetical protein
MKVGNWALFCLVTLMAVTIGPAAAEQAAHPAAPQDERLEFLKGLQGSWVGQFGDEMGEQRYEFRVTAGGHAVEEREMLGTPMEMLTVYYLEGEDVVGTHFCMLGNRPRVKATTRVENNTLTFACNGTPGNSKSHDEEHVHGWSMRLDADGRLHYSAELVRAGQVTQAPAVVLTRSVETATR